MITIPVQKLYSDFTRPFLKGFRRGRNLILFLFLYSVSTQVGTAQTNNTIVPSPVMPMSPNASSLAIFTDYPVSHYTGVPNISVPLCQADIDGFKLPIALNYHASGILVSQESSWVGLGWALNAGGSISRSIKGGDDFLEYLDTYTLAGYYKDQDLDNPLTNTRYYALLPGNNRLQYDTEPDIFYYSLPGASGKFVIDKNRGPVLMDKGSNVKIEIVHDTSISNFWNKNLCFQITTPDGTKYYYKQRETTRSYSNGQALNQNSTDPDRVLDGGLGPNPPFEYTSSWMLEKITTVNKREINFQYTLETYESPTQESCSKSNILQVNGGGCASFPTYGAVAYQWSKTRHESLRLTSIVWDQGHIDFTASTREDMRGWLTNAPPKKLDMVQVFDQGNALVKQVNLNYSYFNPDKTGQYDYVFKRLKLENVVMDSDVKNRYLFHYIPGELLAKNSKNKDYWGHHNGKVYGAEYYVGASNSTSIYYGANKSANVDFMKMGTLNEIVYPTGGSTTFIYEANTYNKSDFNLTVPEYVPSSEKVMEVYYDYSNIGAYDGLPVSDVYQFTLTQPNRISLQKIIENTVCPSSDPNFSYAHPGYPIGRLKKISPTTSTIFSFGMPLVNGQNNYCQYAEYSYGVPLTSSDFNSEVLPAGTYVFEALTPPRDIYIRWRINFLTQEPGASVDPNAPVPGGGLRIAKIITGNQTKTYTYPKGKMLITPVLAYTKTFFCEENPVVYQMVTLQQLSESSMPLSTLRGGNSIGYDWVEESMASGKVRHSFYNEPEESLDEASGTGVTYFPYAPTTINYLNGLTYKTEYLQGNALFKSIDYTYEPRYSNTIYGFMYNANDNEGLVYGYRFNWLLKSSEVTKTFFAGIPIEELKMYSYNDDFQLSGSKKYINGLWEEQKVKYARDFSGSVYQSMMDRYQIGIPIETINLKNNLVVAASKTNYFETLGLNVPKEIYTLSTTSPLAESNYQGSYQKKADYELYNANGKILQLNEKGKTTSFIWGYKNYFPVAKINGASYAQATGLLDMPTLQSLEQNPSDGVIDGGTDLLRNSLTDAQVYSYTFKPLVGVTGITNERGQKTGYFYNANNRLDHIKDHLGNISKSFAYNYRGNSTPFTTVDLGITTPEEGLAYLDNGNGSPYPSKFRISIYNKYTGVTYTYDVDSKTKRIGGFPPGYYKVSIVNLDNMPLSNFSIQIYGDEFIDGVLDYLALDGGFNLLSIVYTGP